MFSSLPMVNCEVPSWCQYQRRRMGSTVIEHMSERFENDATTRTSPVTRFCRTTEHNTATGDDRGGIAVGNGQVFYTGDERTVAFIQALADDAVQVEAEQAGTPFALPVNWDSAASPPGVYFRRP